MILYLYIYITYAILLYTKQLGNRGEWTCEERENDNMSDCVADKTDWAGGG